MAPSFHVFSKALGLDIFLKALPWVLLLWPQLYLFRLNYVHFLCFIQGACFNTCLVSSSMIARTLMYLWTVSNVIPHNVVLLSPDADSLKLVADSLPLCSMYPVQTRIERLTEKVALFYQQVATFLMEVCCGRLQWLLVVCAEAADGAAACLDVVHSLTTQDSVWWKDGPHVLIVGGKASKDTTNTCTTWHDNRAASVLGGWQAPKWSWASHSTLICVVRKVLI